MNGASKGSSATTMRAAILYGRQDIRVEEVPVPKPGRGEVLVRIKAALTCGTDLKVYAHGTHARMLKPPARFGHEFSGIVEEIGPGVTRWQPGTRAVAANSAPCRACFTCQRGQENLCEDLLFVNGAYAEFLLLPERIVRENLLEIPSSLSFQAAALTEPLACVVRGWEAIAPRKGETAILVGTGPIGLMFIQLLRNSGVQVLAVGKGEGRLQSALQLGAKQVFNLSELKDPVAALKEATPHGKGADLVIEAVGRPEAWSQAVEFSRPGGRTLLFGGCPAGTKVSLDAAQIHYGERSLLSVFHHTPEAIRQALRLLSEGIVTPEPLISCQIPLAQLPALFQQMLGEKAAAKTAVIP